MLKFLVFSDLHLVDTGETSHGLDTFKRFAAGVDWVNMHHADADFVVLAGDLAEVGDHLLMAGVVEAFAVDDHAGWAACPDVPQARYMDPGICGIVTRYSIYALIVYDP